MRLSLLLRISKNKPQKLILSSGLQSLLFSLEPLVQFLSKHLYFKLVCQTTVAALSWSP